MNLRARSQPAASPSGPVRTCVGCRGVGSRVELVRFVLVDGVPVLDPGKTMHGRGAWLHNDDACRALADKRRSLSRALQPRSERRSR